MQQYPDILLFAVPGFVLLTIAETIVLIKEGSFGKYKKDLPVSFSIGVGFIVISFFSRAMLLVVYQWVYARRIYTLPVDTWYSWAGCFFSEDFSYYWFHRISHRVRVLWASHSVHHTAEVYSLTSAGFRQTWTGNFSGTFLFWIWMPYIGFNPGMVILVKSINLIYQFCIHTETIRKMPPWFEAVFNTPSHHRVHHGSDLLYLDKNYGGTLVIWDKLFGTFQPEEAPPTYGLAHKISSDNPFTIVFGEWINMFSDIKKCKSLKECCYYCFGAPGWSKDGSSKTTRQLRKEVLLNDKKAALPSTGELV